jgi:hypothetical protein
VSPNQSPHAPPSPGTHAARAEEAVKRAESAVLAAERDPTFRAQADSILDEALNALRAFCAAAETAQAHARHLGLVGARDPDKAERARQARQTFRRVAIQLEALGVRFRRADRRLLRFGRPPNLVERLRDWMAP